MQRRSANPKGPGNRARTPLVALLLLLTASAGLALALRRSAGQGADQLPPGKQEVLDLEKQELEAALSKPEPARPSSPQPPFATPDPPPPTGILANPQAPFPASAGKFNNKWAGIVGGYYVQAVAGATREDPAQGLVLVWSTPLEQLSPTGRGHSGRYLSPQKGGALEIVGEQGGVLKLVSSGGAVLYFSVLDGTYASR